MGLSLHISTRKKNPQEYDRVPAGDAARIQA